MQSVDFSFNIYAAFKDDDETYESCLPQGYDDGYGEEYDECYDAYEDDYSDQKRWLSHTDGLLGPDGPTI